MVASAVFFLIVGFSSMEKMGRPSALTQAAPFCVLCVPTVFDKPPETALLQASQSQFQLCFVLHSSRSSVQPVFFLHLRKSHPQGRNPQTKQCWYFKAIIPAFLCMTVSYHLFLKCFLGFFIVILLYSFAWHRCNHFFVLEYKSWQVCVWGKDSAFCLFSLFCLMPSML